MCEGASPKQSPHTEIASLAKALVRSDRREAEWGPPPKCHCEERSSLQMCDGIASSGKHTPRNDRREAEEDPPPGVTARNEAVSRCVMGLLRRDNILLAFTDRCKR